MATYSEDIPSVGCLSNYTGNYIRHHNPPSYFTDVVSSNTQRQHLQSFAAFQSDLASGSLTDYSMILPNVYNDGHSCSIDTVDQWLKNNVDTLIKNPVFQRDALLIITWDESRTGSENGGGRIPFILGPLIKRGYSSSALYQHQSALRMTMKALGLGDYPGLAATAPDMDEPFIPQGWDSPEVSER